MRPRILIELLHSPVCRGADDAERLVREIVEEYEGAGEPAFEFRRVLVLTVDDPNAARIYGSPTVLVNGRDSQLPRGVEPAAAGLAPSLA